MIQIHHLNCVEIQSPSGMRAIGHCLLIAENSKLVLVDTGISLLDVKKPMERIGKDTIDLVGYQFDENLTAIRQLSNLGFNPEDVTDCVISHLDYDHISGVADFPNAIIHVGQEELKDYSSGNSRYTQLPFQHKPKILSYAKSDDTWHGLEARKITLKLSIDIYFIPLFGHTNGHCGVAIKIHENWLFYVGDAYYYRDELYDSSHPVNELAQMACEDNLGRLESLKKIKEVIAQNPKVKVYSFHDPKEFEQV